MDRNVTEMCLSTKCQARRKQNEIGQALSGMQDAYKPSKFMKLLLYNLGCFIRVYTLPIEMVTVLLEYIDLLFVFLAKYFTHD